MSERNRLAWRCRRGMLELDLLLEGFLARGYDALAPGEQADFVRLLDLPDQELLEALFGTRHLMDRGMNHVVTCIRRSAAS